MIKIPVEIGDTILTGRFKNKPVVVKTIGTDEHGMPTINGKKVVTFRLKKKEKNEMKRSELKQIIKEEVKKVLTEAKQTDEFTVLDVKDDAEMILSSPKGKFLFTADDDTGAEGAELYVGGSPASKKIKKGSKISFNYNDVEGSSNDRDYYGLSHIILNGKKVKADIYAYGGNDAVFYTIKKI